METVHTLYRTAQQADDALQSALVKAYGKNAGDIRYQPSKQTPEIRALGDAFSVACDAWRNSIRKVA